MLIYMDNEQAKTLTDILEGTIFREEFVDWADYKQDDFGRTVRIERPDLNKVSKDRTRLCAELINNIKAVL